MKKLYYINQKKFILRTILLILVYGLALFDSNLLVTVFNYDFGFFRLYHVLWMLLMIEMIIVCIPSLNQYVSCGKLFLRHHQLPKQKFNPQQLISEYIFNNQGALKSAIFWLILLCIIGVLTILGVLGTLELLLISVFFYFADEFCINVWCPFRSWFIHNKCCNTCRIYNWGHFMMFSPLIFVPSFWTYTLLLLSLFILIQWEVMHFLYPERFYEISNDSLKCRSCLNAQCHYIKQGIQDRKQ